MMVALVMVSNYISIPTAFSRLHVANAMHAGRNALGGLRGAVIAGLGSALYDLTYPAYAAEAWITFLTKGIMALVCGMMIVNSKGSVTPDVACRWDLLQGFDIHRIVYAQELSANAFCYGCSSGHHPNCAAGQVVLLAHQWFVRCDCGTDSVRSHNAGLA